MARNSREGAAITRSAVLDRASALGSLEGLETLSIGRLASELGLSKSGVVGQFGSKEKLQLAAVQASIERFGEEVWEPIAGEAAGITRLRALMDSWLSYLEREVYPGGCFLTAASAEFDNRPGPVRDAIAGSWASWLKLIEREAATAQAQEELTSEVDPREIAFRLQAYVMQGNFAKQLFGDPSALERSRAAILELLG